MSRESGVPAGGTQTHTGTNTKAGSRLRQLSPGRSGTVPQAGRGQAALPGGGGRSPLPRAGLGRAGLDWAELGRAVPGSPGGPFTPAGRAGERDSGEGPGRGGQGRSPRGGEGKGRGRARYLRGGRGAAPALGKRRRRNRSAEPSAARPCPWLAAGPSRATSAPCWASRSWASWTAPAWRCPPRTGSSSRETAPGRRRLCGSTGRSSRRWPGRAGARCTMVSARTAMLSGGTRDTAPGWDPAGPVSAAPRPWGVRAARAENRVSVASSFTLFPPPRVRSFSLPASAVTRCVAGPLRTLHCPRGNRAEIPLIQQPLHLLILMPSASRNAPDCEVK